MFEHPDNSSLSADLAAELSQRQTVLKAGKRIARKVLMQRADLESFLTDSIQVCRDQTIAEQKQKKRNERLALLHGSSQHMTTSGILDSDTSMQQEPTSSSLQPDA